MKFTFRAVFIAHLSIRGLKTLLLLSGLLVWALPGRGQYFVADGAPCPGGNDVKLDTLTFTPDKAMPFDRCFYLRITLPGVQSVTQFGITPIDKRGNPKARRRDYRVFRRSAFPSRQQRHTFVKLQSYSEFKIEPLKRIFTGVTTTLTAKSTEVVLRVPPLDPGREYRITLIGNDDIALKEVLEISELIIKSKRIADPSLLSQAKQKHLASSTKSNNHPIGLRATSFDEYGTQLTSFGLLFNLNKGGAEETYRIFFSPQASPIADVTIAQAIDKKLSINIDEAASPQSISFTLPLTITTGISIQPFTPGTYNIQVLTTYRKNSPNSVPTLTNLGVFSILADNVTYSFTPNTQIADNVYVEFINNPIAQFTSIQSAKDSISRLSTAPRSCPDSLSLHFLMQQAALCPCEKEGIKDLTQKDDLMRVISVLYGKDATLFNNSWDGLLNLKDPFAKALQPEDYALRIANLKSSQTQLSDLIEFARKEATYHLAQSRNIQQLLKCLGSWQIHMAHEATQLDNIVKAQEALAEVFTESLRLKQARPLALGSTTELNLVSDTKLRIMPDFGFVALFKGDKLYTFQDFTPYLGFEVGFRAMDKNIPLRLIRYKSFWHHLSFMSGVTLRSLKIENQRDDFFGSSSLITGLGYRLNNYLRLTGGTVWFKATDPSKLSNNKPIRISPFVGLSIDLDVQELFGGISKLFK